MNSTAQSVATSIRRRAVIFDKKDPLAAARAWAREHMVNGLQGILSSNGETWHWSGTAWEQLPDDALAAQLWPWLAACVDLKGNEILPNRALVADVRAALAALTHLRAGGAPRWLAPADGDPDPADLIVCQNGVLHARTRELLPSTPRLFATSVLPIDADPGAPKPEAWLTFLGQLFGDDQEALELLQEWLGLCALTDDTRHQKALLLVGPKRSGKGTILRVMRELAGAANVCSPTFASLGTPFGLQPLIGKRIAMLSDARSSARTDFALVAETLLRVSGEDAVNVSRKHLPDWSGKLSTRFTIATNELPHFADASAALSSRFLILRLMRSFYGAEDHQLTDKLLRELPGILLWAIDGLDRLRKRGRLLQPTSGQELVEELEALASPISLFVRDCCVLSPAAEGAISALYERWLAWCREAGRDHPGTVAGFGRQLRAAFPQIRQIQPRRQGRQIRCYAGIRPRDSMDFDGTTS